MKKTTKITLTLTPEELEVLQRALFSEIRRNYERIEQCEVYPDDEYLAAAKQEAQAKMAKLEPLSTMTFNAKWNYERGQNHEQA